MLPHYLGSPKLLYCYRVAIIEVYHFFEIIEAFSDMSNLKYEAKHDPLGHLHAIEVIQVQIPPIIALDFNFHNYHIEQE